MKQVYYKVIKTFVILVGMFACFSILNQTVFAKTIHTRASSKNVYKYNVEKNYKYVIRPKKTGIMKMKLSLKTNEDFDLEDYYGFVDCYVQDYYLDDIYTTSLDSLYHSEKKKKTISFLVEKGKKYYIDLRGEYYSFDIEWKIKKLTKPMFKRTTTIDNSKLKLRWTSFRKAKSYELQISPNKKFKKKTRRLITSGTSKVVKVKKNKKYYVRVRAKSYSGRNNVSKWSKRITVWS